MLDMMDLVIAAAAADMGAIAAYLCEQDLEYWDQAIDQSAPVVIVDTLLVQINIRCGGRIFFYLAGL